MRRISDLETFNRHVLRRDAGLADTDVFGTNVFVPGLMGAGILLSAALLVSDGIQALVPSLGLRRRINVARGVRGTVVEVAAAAGLPVDHHSLLPRRPRSRWFYGLVAVVTGLLAVLATTWGFDAFWGHTRFEGNAIVIVFGLVAGVANAIISATSAALAAYGENLPRRLTRLVQATVAGRMQSPPDDRVARARLLIPNLSEGDQR